MLSVVNDDGTTANGSSLVDEVVREGARRMLAAALEAEVNAYIAELADQCDERGRRLVVRNGYHQPRKVTTAAGIVEVKAPRVNDKRVDETTSERKRFSSAILPPWCCRSPKISEVLPLLYLHGLSSGDFVPALEQFLGSSAGLSPATVTRLTQQWQADHAAFMDRDLAEVDYVYVWPKPAYSSSSACAPTAATRTATSRSRRSRRSPSSTERSSPRPSRRSAMMRPSCWRSTTSPPSTGSTCGRPTRSSPHSPPSAWRTKVTRGAGSRTAGLAMVFKLVESAQARWRAVNAPHLVALVHAGARFEHGQLVERPATAAA